MVGPACNYIGNNTLCIEKYLSEWHENGLKTLAKDTADTKLVRLKHFITTTNITKLTDITYFKIQKYLDELHDYYAPNTVSNWKHSISSFCTYLIRRDLIPYHPCRMVQLPKIIMVSPDYLTDDEVHQFVAAAELHGVSIPIKLAIGTGMRRQELANLQWGDINLTRRLIQVVNKKNFLVKNRKIRMIPIMDRLYDDITNLAMAIHPESDHYLIRPRHWKKTNRRITARTMDTFLDPIKNMFVGRIITWRILRHTFASLLAQNGVSYYKIASWLGNNPAICEKYYCNNGQRFDPDINKIRAQDRKG